MFNNTWRCIYPRPRKLVFDYVYEFKRDFTPLLKYFDIKPVLTTINNQKANDLVEQVHQLILNMIVTKDPDNKVFDYIYP